VRHDTQRYSKYLRLNGWEEVASPYAADLIIYTTCGVIKDTEDFALQSIANLQKMISKNTTFLVGGCLSKINPNSLKKVFKGTTFSKADESMLDSIINATVSINDVFWDGDIIREHSPGDPFLYYTNEELNELKLSEKLAKKFKNQNFIEIYNYLTKGRFFWKEEGLFEVKVADGCLFNCSYCAAKRAKGTLKSRPLEKILAETKFGVSKGYKRIVLTGDEVGDYGWDISSSLPDLLEKIDPITKNIKIAVRYITPDSLIKNIDRLEPFFKKGKIYYLCASFQSGSDEILKKMNRPRDLNKFLPLIRRLKHDYPLLFIHTQVIVGFPGETKQDFNKTIKALEFANFDYITITRYSDRPGVSSSKMKGHISKSEMDRRYLELRTIESKMRRRKLEELTFREISESDC
jgi:MiaB/RimO family radical SAM methylthiotransferase